ncbi:bifunctional demethylmenaquinone methyltransferase/2-methoxy-6-polyprenyl-1,4-benzoquinol methylase UbiE [Flammeovirgaceae bacterium SG7u.111]|nr:bifunctional demethylmenaquinone methyltransferase/2-methoxy-6-polyprenyl-1,4-benzoquinol methylase UbiE [Flammeovirgaceae bacterium SG7u.132]WPO36802.1 bifunctional demethylmenaquinone methyltransferase/2-methoxy-6-polyprenyl-1,4-benzoquinol methylase UbiE [Flammeovirgaceae bacterium SG7u.111]
MAVLPYKGEDAGKKQQVAKMFNSIAGKYDFLNHFLSLGIDIRWRKKAIGYLKEQQPESILDVATGTGDLAIEALSLKPKKIVGVDISEGMLEVGKKKIAKMGVDNVIELHVGDSENLQFPDKTFDAVMVAFGVRNFENLEKGLADIKRVLKDDGTLVVLEFSKPQKFPFKQIYNFYFKFILPVIGKVVSKDNAAYTYLPESVSEFPYGKSFLGILNKLGYKSTQCKELTFGISSIYIGKK